MEIGLLQYPTFLDVELNKLTWAHCSEPKNLAKTLKKLATEGLDEKNESSVRDILKKTNAFQQKLNDYNPSFCQIVWSIITFSFTYFKVKKLKNNLKKLATKIDDITNPIFSKMNQEEREEAQTAAEKAIVQRKLKIITEALGLVQQDFKASDEAALLNQDVINFFKKTQKCLKKNENVPIGGGFYHCTRELGYVKLKEYGEGDDTLEGKGAIAIIAHGSAETGRHNAYGDGLYGSTTPEIGICYGEFCFAIDDASLGNQYNYLVINDNRFWTIFPRSVLINRKTAILSVPDDQLEDAIELRDEMLNLTCRPESQSRKRVQIITNSVALKALKYIHQAQENLELVEFPAGSRIRSIYNAVDTFPDRYKDAFEELQKRPKHKDA